MTLLPSHVVRELQQVGWLPPGQECALTSADDLLTHIVKRWTNFDGQSLPRGQRQRAEARLNWWAEQMAQGAELVWLPTESSELQNWLGARFVWWPHGQPLGNRIGLASSRLGRRLDTQAAWFAVLRAACAKIHQADDVLLTAVATTPQRFVQRAAELFGVRVISLETPRERESLGSWVARLEGTESHRAENVFPAYLSPELHAPQDAAVPVNVLAHTALRDRAVVALSARLLVFHLRRNGRLERVVRERLSSDQWPVASVFIALGRGLVERDLADQLLDMGAVGWIVWEDQTNPVRQPAPPSTSWTSSSRPPPIVALPSDDDWEFLTHCTRAPAGPWPDETGETYLDELLLSRHGADRSAMAALRRIIEMRRLVATCRMIRGNTPTVCFTAVPLGALPQLHVFRRHLGRWDFEPYGICIRRDWLAERNCQPARYGDEHLWQTLSPAERPFFQVATSRTEVPIDWTCEREWRHVGDVPLDELPTDSGLVFVPTLEEAQALARCSRWPIAVLSHTKSS